MGLRAQGDCIPPRMDHYDCGRPIYTVSLLSEQSIILGSTCAT